MSSISKNVIMIVRSFSKDNITYEYQLIYKKRKSLGIYIDVYGNMELRVPKGTKDETIETLLSNKWSWIHKKISESKEKTEGFKEKEYKSGESFLYLGKEYPIKLHQLDAKEKAHINFDGQVLNLYINSEPEEQIKKLLTRFYKKECKKKVESRIRYYQSYFKVKPRDIKINANKKTWGTCNNLREMTFNWKLVMAPIEVLDYVVVHEMCHMVHLNHDRSFWRLVGKIMPEYEVCQQWLKDTYWKMVV